MFLKSSLADLQLDYVDLYLVHTPVALALIGPGEDLKKQENGDVVMESVDHLAVWKVTNLIFFLLGHYSLVSMR